MKQKITHIQLMAENCEYLKFFTKKIEKLGLGVKVLNTIQCKYQIFLKMDDQSLIPYYLSLNDIRFEIKTFFPEAY